MLLQHVINWIITCWGQVLSYTPDAPQLPLCAHFRRSAELEGHQGADIEAMASDPAPYVPSFISRILYRYAAARDGLQRLLV